MTTRDTPFSPGTPCWVDLASSDLDRSNAFYQGLFGWDAEASGDEYGNYVMYSSDGHAVAGAMPKQPGMDFPDTWTTYISTADCAATESAATSAGGQVMMNTMPVGEVGTMAVLSDPVGAVFGIWQAGQHTGFGKYNEPGSVTWDEHHSKNFPTSKSFYGTVFGWELEPMSDTDDFRYVIAKVDGESVAGLMDSSSFLPAEVPSHWAVYFSVADADAAASKVAELGGTVVRPPEDTPFGRIADVTDPTGAMFRLHQDTSNNDAQAGA